VCACGVEAVAEIRREIAMSCDVREVRLESCGAHEIILEVATLMALSIL
jgi:hypothetical protein